ncbi:MAG: hypothetical protein A2035_00450 [Nitrospirae bacterium GWA2_42_11]|nr:MAG: hypothetical protein A2035_00450 [Nitrospirae bacterium GWA2_42_11]OGW58103.1 MAG: hypothetical protein A3D21_04040 [Nitrospirae bacterium RIFCSPHIGHO2_02_FULL_42_12]
MGKKILVAESDSAVQQVVSYFLDLEGYEVTTAADGIGALEAVEKSLPEVILLSPDLSGLNGIEVSRLIREKSQFKGIPILYIIDSEDSLLKMGQDIPPGYGVINKPIDPSKMTNTIKEYIDKAKQSQEEEAGGVSIEELLGWEVTEESKEKEAASQEEKPDINAVFTDLFGTAESEQTFTTPKFAEELRAATIYEEVPTEPEKKETFQDTEAVEADLKSRITDDMIKDIVSRISRDIIERVVSDVVPRIAEEEIKKEIERLKGDSG